jgi:hypothetical protein
MRGGKICGSSFAATPGKSKPTGIIFVAVLTTGNLFTV